VSADSGPCLARFPDELVEFFQAGVSIQLGTCDAELVPEGIRAVGAVANRDRTRVTIFLNDRTSARTLRNLSVNPKCAVCFSRPGDHRSIQIKGRVVATRPASEADRVVVERYVPSLMEALSLVGISRSLTGRLAHWPSTAVDVEVDELFHQTPGPGAGRKLET